MEYTEFLVFISIFLLAEIIGAQDKELLLQREKIARMNEIQIAMRRQPLFYIKGRLYLHVVK